MLAYTYIEQGKFELLEKQRPQIKDSRVSRNGPDPHKRSGCFPEIGGSQNPG